MADRRLQIKLVSEGQWFDSALRVTDLETGEDIGRLMVQAIDLHVAVNEDTVLKLTLLDGVAVEYVGTMTERSGDSACRPT